MEGAINKIKSQLNSLIKTSIFNFIPPFIIKKILNSQITGFYYHIVSDDKLPHLQHLYNYNNVDQFIDHLKYIRKMFNIVSFEQLNDHVYKNIQLPNNSAFITFDDGFVEWHSIIAPILLEYGIPCIFFISTDTINNKDLLWRHKISLCINESIKNNIHSNKIKNISQLLGKNIESFDELEYFLKSIKFKERAKIDKVCEILSINTNNYLNKNNPYLTRDQIIDLSNMGFTIGAHGIKHCKLNEVSDSEAEKEIIESYKQIETIIDGDYIPFAFPFSGTGFSENKCISIIKKCEKMKLIFDRQGMRQRNNLFFDRIELDQVTPDIAIRNSLKKYYFRDRKFDA